MDCLFKEEFEMHIFYFYILGSTLVSNIVFWGINGFLLITYITDKPKFLTQYRVQTDKNVPVSLIFSCFLRYQAHFTYYLIDRLFFTTSDHKNL